MSNQELSIQEELKKHLSASICRLQNNKDLTVDECVSIEKCLEVFKNTLNTDSLSEEQAVGNSFEELIHDFNSSAESTSQMLQDMLLLITQGRVPERVDVEKFDVSMDNLQNSYSSITKYVSAIISEDEMPATGSPVNDYISALENSKIIQYQKLVDDARQKIDAFVSVRSMIDLYTDALRPFQEKAEKLLTILLNEEETDVERLGEEIAAPTAFMDALACEDYDTQESLEILDLVDQYFPRNVSRGLSGGKYFLDQEVLRARLDARYAEDVSHGIDESQDEIVMVPVTDIHQEADLEQNNSTEQYSKDSITENDESIDTREDSLEPVEDLSDEGDIAKSDFVKRLIENNAFIHKGEAIGLLSKDISSAENKKLSSSIFLNEVRRRNEYAAKKILEGLCRTNCISIDYLTAKQMPVEKAESTIADLYKKGYLRKYTLTPGGDFYCASPRCIKALTFKEPSKFVGIRQMSINDWGETIDDKESSAAARISFLTIATEIIRTLNDIGTVRYSDTMTFFTDAFSYGVKDVNHPENCFVSLGAFWDNDNECDLFFDRITEIIQENGDAKALIIAGIDKVRAHAIARALLQSFDDDLIHAVNRISLFSFLEHDFYSYDSLEMISSFEAFNIEEETEENDEKDNPKELVKSNDSANGTDESESEDISQNDNDIKYIALDADNTTTSLNSEIDSPEKESVKNTVDKKPETVLQDEKNAEKKTGIEEGEKNLITETPKKKQLPKAMTTNEEFRSTICAMLADGRFYAAVAYAKARSNYKDDIDGLYDLLAYALNDPMRHCTYSANNAFNLISRRSEFDDALIISVAVRTFFSNQVQYDYQIKPFYNGVKEYSILSRYSSLNNILYTLMEFKNNQNKGMDFYADYHAKSQAEREQEISKIREEAKTTYQSVVVSRKKENASQRRFLETKKLMFAVTSDFGQYLKSIVDGDREVQPLIVDFLKKEFLKDDGDLSEDSISSDKLWTYIVRYWEMAGDNMMYRRHADLMSHLRSNITNLTLKVVQLLLRWCIVIEESNGQVEDEGTSAYRIKRNTLLADLEKTIEEIDINRENVLSTEEKAGLCVLGATLNDIRKRIDGTYSEAEKKYFYAPFLLTDDVILDENYFPDLDIHSAELTTLSPEYRITNHVRSISQGTKTYPERLSEILDEQGDDYGSARLIAKYLADITSMQNYTDQMKIIESGVNYAHETADIRKDDFIGELELAQSFGQIDNSEEDKKEKILQIINGWYEWAVDTSNYGFFKKVMDCYLAEIRKEAKEREADLLEQLESFRETQISGLTTEIKEKRAKRILKMIQEQNYTVAEDLLARASNTDEEHEEIIDEDFLKEFIDNYDDYYKPVATHKSNFSSLVSSRTRNKEARGAKKLADNWLPGGSKLGVNRLEGLLSCLGFNVGSIKDLSSNNRFESYDVITKAAENGRRENFTHPIAAFGSAASSEGFRVVCINGNYDANGLIDLMKQIGNSKHTLILHDHALSLSERRRLARKARNALGDKFFGVIDRTIMMFLVRNYDETKINRMLISLIMPFGYYQPYVWESVNVMPPEIFMGRKIELERIESPTGVNIVYGGRQLGKSALLKKANEDIDQDENGNRAIYIDIKGCNYEEAANKVGHELYDQYVLTEDIDTTDWDELSRVIRRRLQEKEKRIPYLLLLLDEADAFIESCERVNYKPLDALKAIQNIGAKRFKFVIAGLRNIVRLNREVALGNNSVLTHLEAMTVKPFKTSEARELMEIPLHYLGLRFPKDKESLVTLILATTNYFPGLIQMYCAKLLESMRRKDYAGYDEANTPIYEVSESHIKKILADPEFTQQIRQKFEITLSLDEDNYYYLIALIMAYLYHSNGYSDGYSAEDIHRAGSELDILKVSDLSIQKLLAYMEELRELNVLRNTDDTHYLFTRFTFFQMMGTSSEVEDKLVEFMEG